MVATRNPTQVMVAWYQGRARRRALLKERPVQAEFEAEGFQMLARVWAPEAAGAAESKA